MVTILLPKGGISMNTMSAIHKKRSQLTCLVGLVFAVTFVPALADDRWTDLIGLKVARGESVDVYVLNNGSQNVEVDGLYVLARDPLELAKMEAWDTDDQGHPRTPPGGGKGPFISNRYMNSLFRHHGGWVVEPGMVLWIASVRSETSNVRARIGLKGQAEMRDLRLVSIEGEKPIFESRNKPKQASEN